MKVQQNQPVLLLGEAPQSILFCSPGPPQLGARPPLPRPHLRAVNVPTRTRAGLTPRDVLTHNSSPLLASSLPPAISPLAPLTFISGHIPTPSTHPDSVALPLPKHFKSSPKLPSPRGAAGLGSPRVAGTWPKALGRAGGRGDSGLQQERALFPASQANNLVLNYGPGLVVCLFLFFL